MAPAEESSSPAGAARQMALSAPIYPYRHSGTVLVCGFASTLHADLEEARRLRPDAEIIAVNRAATIVPAFAIFSQHFGREKLGAWAKEREKLGGEFTVHAPGALDWLERNNARYPWVNYWWPDARGTGTSTWAACKMAKMMGFSEIIICGMALARVPYADGTIARDFRHQKITELYRNYIRNDKRWHSGVVAMSGWPRKMFGGPGGRGHADQAEGIAPEARAEGGAA